MEVTWPFLFECGVVNVVELPAHQFQEQTVPHRKTKKSCYERFRQRGLAETVTVSQLVEHKCSHRTTGRSASFQAEFQRSCPAFGAADGSSTATESTMLCTREKWRSRKRCAMKMSRLRRCVLTPDCSIRTCKSRSLQ